jgi:hypothetical protein
VGARVRPRPAADPASAATRPNLSAEQPGNAALLEKIGVNE